MREIPNQSNTDEPMHSDRIIRRSRKITMRQCSSTAGCGCLLAMLILCVSASTFAEKTTSENPYGTDLSVTNLDIDVKTDFQSNTVDVSVIATVENFSKKTLNRGEFWLCPGGFNDSAFGADVRHVHCLNGDRRTELLCTMHKIDKTWESYRIAFAQPVAPGGKVLLRFEYTMTGKPDHSSSPILMSEDGVKEIYLRGGDYLWCPTPYYDIKGHVRMYAPNWTLRITYPTGNAAVVDGELLRRDEKNGWIQDEWKSLTTSPGMPYLFLGPYKTARWDEAGMTFEIYVADDALLNKTIAQFETYAQVFQYGSELYGKPTYPTYRLVGSAVAGVGNSFTNGHIVHISELENTRLNAHEIAHTWWGGLVSTYGDGSEFLSESMAEFTARWILSVMGEDLSPDRSLSDGNIIGWKQRRYCCFLPVCDQDSRDPPLIVPANSGLSTAPARFWGTLVVNQIRQVLGDGVFFRCLRTFVDECRGSQADIEDFIRTINSVSGRNMTSLLNGMLRSGGYASYRVVELESERAGAEYRTRIRIKNEGDFGLSCPLELKTLGGQARKTINVEAGQEKEFGYTTTHRVLNAIIDPDMTTLLQYHPEQKLRLYKAMLETIDGYGNNEAYGASYVHYVQGEFDKAVEPVTRYLDKRRKRDRFNEFVFMRGIFYLASGDLDLAEKDIKGAFPHMLDALEHDGSVRTPSGYHNTGAISRKDLDEYLSLLGLIAGRRFAFEDGMAEQAKLQRISEWKQWWQRKGKQQKLNPSLLKERFEARRQAFRRTLYLTD